jgi:hypothetical protein
MTETLRPCGTLAFTRYPCIAAKIILRFNDDCVGTAIGNLQGRIVAVTATMSLLEICSHGGEGGQSYLHSPWLRRRRRPQANDPPALSRCRITRAMPDQRS